MRAGKRGGKPGEFCRQCYISLTIEVLDGKMEVVGDVVAIKVRGIISGGEAGIGERHIAEIDVARSEEGGRIAGDAVAGNMTVEKVKWRGDHLLSGSKRVIIDELRHYVSERESESGAAELVFLAGRQVIGGVGGSGGSECESVL